MFTVLVVDDSKNIRDFCQRELERSGYRVLLASDGREALAICERRSPDLMVLDARMPGLNGQETLRQLDVRYPGIPVIVHSSERSVLPTSSAQVPERAFVEKSADLGTLKSSIARLLAARSRRQSP